MIEEFDTEDELHEGFERIEAIYSEYRDLLDRRASLESELDDLENEIRDFRDENREIIEV